LRDRNPDNLFYIERDFGEGRVSWDVFLSFCCGER
jgi:hypothetical protein